ncbi:MAG: hypothetical protein EOO89_26235 [Pedobacter sp.]|nr:MAG: hypothetical protein EOO89_26235 [Pedobacter sp.]
MRKPFTILLLLTMLLLQYSKQMAYLQCKINNSLASKHCDCEKIINENDHPSDDHKNLPAGIIKLIMPDEIFVATSAYAPLVLFSLSKQKPTAFIHCFTPQSFAKELLQPPRAC